MKPILSAVIWAVLGASALTGGGAWAQAASEEAAPEEAVEATGAPEPGEEAVEQASGAAEAVAGEGAGEAGEAAETAGEEAAGEEEQAASRSAAAMAQARYFLQAGGPVLVILFGLSLLTFAVIAVKVVQFALARVLARGFVPRTVQMVREGRRQEALAFVEHKHGPVARVLEAAIRGLIAAPGEPELVREEVARVAQARLDGLERGLPLLGLVATISPLLGLLGTVTGMIEAFQNMQIAGDQVDPAILSGGIWEALLTTAAGLAIAIPAAAVFTWLQRTVEVAAQRMEDAATQVFTVKLYDAAPGTAAAPAAAQEAA